MASSQHIKKNKLIKKFNGWQEGYGAFTYSIRDKEKLIEYVKDQEQHHLHKTSREEFLGLLDEHGVEFDDKYCI